MRSALSVALGILTIGYLCRRAVKGSDRSAVTNEVRPTLPAPAAEPCSDEAQPATESVPSSQGETLAAGHVAEEPAEAGPTPDRRRSMPPRRGEKSRRGRTRRTGVLGAVTGFLFWAVALGVGLLVAGSLLGAWGLVPVLTGSMRPGVQPGDAVLVTSEPVTAVRVGQVVVFQPPGEGGASVVHRIIAVSHDPGRTVIRTKGDANNVADPWHASLGNARAWRVRILIPKLGYLAVAEHDPKVRLVVELALLVGGIGIALSVVWRSEKSHEPELADLASA